MLDWLPGTSEVEKAEIKRNIRDLFDHPHLAAPASQALAAIGKNAIPKLLSEFVGLDVTKQSDALRGNAVDQTLAAMAHLDMDFDPADFPRADGIPVADARGRAIRRWFGWWEVSKNAPLRSETQTPPSPAAIGAGCPAPHTLDSQLVEVAQPPEDTVSARLVDGNGIVVANTSCQVQVEFYDYIPGRVVTAMSDDRGRLAFSMPGPGTAYIGVFRRDDAQPVLAGSVHRREYSVRETDLGDVRLYAAPTLVSGTVVDEAGLPLGGVDIAIGGFVKSACCGPTELVLSNTLNRFSAVTDSSGSFLVRGTSGMPRLAVLATRQGVRSKKAWFFQQGESELRVVLSP